MQAINNTSILAYYSAVLFLMMNIDRTTRWISCHTNWTFFKWLVRHFGKYVYSLSCWKFGEKIDTTHHHHGYRTRPIRAISLA